MRILLIVCLFAAFACGEALPAEPMVPPQDMLLSRVQALESRVSTLENIARSIGVDVPEAKHDHKLTYAQAHAQSLATGKPLVIWSGAAVCPACVRETSGEFVNCVTGELGAPGKDCVSVFVPEGGQMMTAGRVSWWQTGDATYGHVPSVHRILSNWRSRRTVTYQDAPQSYQGPMMAQAYQASFGMGAPVMQRFGGRFFGGGACASCR